jgi:hypothetical protein
MSSEARETIRKRLQMTVVVELEIKDKDELPRAELFRDAVKREVERLEEIHAHGEWEAVGVSISSRWENIR